MDIKGILHVSGRVVFGKVQGSKIVPVVFDLGAFRNGKAQPAEDMDDLVADQRNRMMRSEGDEISREAEVDSMALTGRSDCQ